MVDKSNIHFMLSTRKQYVNRPPMFSAALVPTSEQSPGSRAPRGPELVGVVGVDTNAAPRPTAGDAIYA